MNRPNILNRTNRKLFSRVMMGLSLPGQYYFITWTSSPESPPLSESWDALRKWLKRERPGCSWCYCWTKEGYGVIHMVVRLGKGERRFNVTRVREHWKNLHHATQIMIKAVKKGQTKTLADYIANQKKVRGMGAQLSFQPVITRWCWSKGWIPKGYTKAFGRLWCSWIDAPLEVRLKVANDAINLCYLDESNVERMTEWSRMQK